MICPACGGETPEAKPFCANCGRPVLAACPSCGAALLLGKAFCADCGAPIAGGAAVDSERSPLTNTPAQVSTSAPRQSASRESAGTERRLCSVLFADLVGFTPLAEQRDPEEVRELLGVYFERAKTIAGHYGGTVEKFIGDAVMVVWGAPVANEDDAERAVRAGLDIVSAVAEIGREAELPELAARAGIVTGEVATAFANLSEGIVLGDTVNSASRLQSAAEPGTVLVDEGTWRAAAGAVAFREVGALTLKGKSEPFDAWQALRVVARRKGVGRAEGLEPPFAGRDTELRLIKDLLHATMREKRARLVSITGVPGIGKSRLGWEFLKYVDGLSDTVYWHQGRSPAYGEGITFWALGEMVRMRIGVNESADAATTREKLAECLSQVVPDANDRKWMEPRLTHLLGLSNAPVGDREELFSAWRGLFERIAALGPSVMVFEDLQWADPGLIDFIESILEWSRNHPILVVTLARPELADRRPTWGAGQRSFTSLHLEPLSREAMGELLDGFVRGLPAEVSEQVLDRSEGVPLYAVEIVRALVARDVLQEVNGAYEVTGDLGSFEIPDSLHSLIGSRLDSLPPEQRTLLQDASILGTTFSTESLAVIQGVERVKLDADLRDLVRKEFLALDTDVRSPERGQYGFVQALIQEVASSRMSRRDRSSKHLAVARHFESLQDDELAGAVAAHYVEAFRAAPEGAAETIARDARQWLTRAGERAQSLGSPEQALSYFEHALEVTSGGTERAPLLELAGRAARSSQANEHAVALFDEAGRLYESAGDAAGLGRTAARIVDCLTQMRRYEEAIERFERALDHADDLDDAARVDLACGVALAYTHSGEPAKSLEAVESALPLAERLDDLSLLARAMRVKASALYQLGRHREAVVFARGVVDFAEAAGALLEQASGHMALSVFVLENSPREALSASSEAIQLARRAGDRGMELTNLLNLAETAVYLGEWSSARRALAELAERDLTDESRAWYSCLEAVVAGYSGEGARAMAVIDDVAVIVAPTGYVHLIATHRAAKANVLLTMGDLPGARESAAEGVAVDPFGINASTCLSVEARSCLWQKDAAGLRSAISELESFRGRWTAAMRRTFEAGATALEGDREAAKEAYRTAFEEWQALECPLDLALAELDYVTVLGADDEVAAGAREHCLALGSSALVERLDWVAAPAPAVG
jgi:class 3 adenylate cyclase/tetratricopeptide (TPR) repeat protein